MSKAPGYRAAGGRLREGVRPELSRVCYPVPDHRIAPMLAAVHAFDKAHVTMLAEAGIIPVADAAAILQGLRELEAGGDVVARRLAAGGTNHSGEVFLTARLGEAVAGHIHTGRSSGDLSAVGNRLTQQVRTLELLDRIQRLRAVVLELAARDKDVLMVGYSHLQHAQPTTLGHYWLSWCAQFERDASRLFDLYDRADTSSAGAAVLTGSPFPLDPARTAELLGFSRAFDNSRDATWSHDAYLEALGVLALCANSQARLAEDLFVWSTAEFDLVELADGFCLNSSILPQKKNPIALQHIRGIAGLTSGHLTAALTITRAPSDSCVLDRHLATEEVWRSFDDVSGATDLLAALLRDLEIKPGRMQEILRESWAWASDLAALLVKECGYTWRTAQQVVSVLVRQLIEAGRRPSSVEPADVSAAAVTYTGKPLVLDPAVLRLALDPAASVGARLVPGGPSPAHIAEQLVRYEVRLHEHHRLLAALAQKRATATRDLESAIDVILAKAGRAG